VGLLRRRCRHCTEEAGPSSPPPMHPLPASCFVSLHGGVRQGSSVADTADSAAARLLRCGRRVQVSALYRCCRTRCTAAVCGGGAAGGGGWLRAAPSPQPHADAQWRRQLWRRAALLRRRFRCCCHPQVPLQLRVAERRAAQLWRLPRQGRSTFSLLNLLLLGGGGGWLRFTGSPIPLAAVAEGCSAPSPPQHAARAVQHLLGGGGAPLFT
jgi:hypothetical protein